jgi:hypothetical protein
VTAKRQIPSNPLIANESPYACRATGCNEMGVWCPAGSGNEWYCAVHRERIQSGQLGIESPEYLAFCEWFADFKRHPPSTPYADFVGTFVRIGAIATLPHLDFEAREERLAIQAESRGD